MKVFLYSIIISFTVTTLLFLNFTTYRYNKKGIDTYQSGTYKVLKSHYNLPILAEIEDKKVKARYFLNKKNDLAVFTVENFFGFEKEVCLTYKDIKNLNELLNKLK